MGRGGVWFEVEFTQLAGGRGRAVEVGRGSEKEKDIVCWTGWLRRREDRRGVKSG